MRDEITNKLDPICMCVWVNCCGENDDRLSLYSPTCSNKDAVANGDLS